MMKRFTVSNAKIHATGLHLILLEISVQILQLDAKYMLSHKLFI